MTILNEHDIGKITWALPNSQDDSYRFHEFARAIEQAVIAKLVGDVEIPQQIVWEIPSYGTDIIFCEGYDESQMREAIAAARLQEREKCIAACHSVAKDADSGKRRPLLTPAGKMLFEGQWGGAMNCANAIRALGETT